MQVPIVFRWQENIMTTADEAKSLARQLRAALSSDGMDVSPSRSLELVSRVLGYADWSAAVAAFDRDQSVGDRFRFTKCSPILRIFDERKAREFYCDFLGFEVAF